MKGPRGGEGRQDGEVIWICVGIDPRLDIHLSVDEGIIQHKNTTELLQAHGNIPAFRDLFEMVDHPTRCDCVPVELE